MADEPVITPDNSAAIPPGVTSGSPPLQVPQMRPELPGIVQLLGSLLKPATGQVPQGFDPNNPNGPQLSRPSRLPAFENFLGTFVNSLAQGMAASGHGPGANERGASAALMAPYNRQVQNFEMQQQAAQKQAQIQQAQAETQKAQVETQLAPKQLQMQEELKNLQLQYENDWRTSALANQSRGLDIKQSHDQWEQQVSQKKLDIESGKLNIAKEMAKYKGMDTESQIQYRAAIAQSLSDKVNIAASLAGQMNQLRTAQAVEGYQKANNYVSVMANLAKSIGVAPGIDQVISMLPNPITLPTSGGAAKVSPAASAVAKGVKGAADKVGSLVGKYGGTR